MKSQETMPTLSLSVRKRRPDSRSLRRVMILGAIGLVLAYFAAVWSLRLYLDNPYIMRFVRDYRVSGRIVRGSDNSPVVNAHVVISLRTQGIKSDTLCCQAVSNGDGYFVIEGESRDNYLSGSAAVSACSPQEEGGGYFEERARVVDGVLEMAGIVVRVAPFVAPKGMETRYRYQTFCPGGCYAVGMVRSRDWIPTER